MPFFEFGVARVLVVQIRQGHQRQVQAPANVLVHLAREIRDEDRPGKERRELRPGLPEVEVHPADPGERHRKGVGAGVEDTAEQGPDPLSTHRLDDAFAGLAFLPQRAEALVRVAEHRVVAGTRHRQPRGEVRGVDGVVAVAIVLLDQDGPARQVHGVLGEDRSDQRERAALRVLDALELLRLHVGCDVVPAVALFEPQPRLREGDAVDPDLAAVQRFCSLASLDAHHVTDAAVHRVGAGELVHVLLVEPQLERGRDHLLRFDLRQRELLPSLQLHAVHAKGRLHPVLHTRSVDELPQFERHVDAHGQAGGLEVQAREHRHRVVVEQLTLRLACRLPAGDDLLHAHAGARRDIHRLEHPIVARRDPRVEQDVLGIGPAPGRLARSRSSVEGAAVDRVEAGDLRSPGGRVDEAERLRRLPGAAGSQQHRHVCRSASDERHRRRRGAAVHGHRHRRTLGRRHLEPAGERPRQELRRGAEAAQCRRGCRLHPHDRRASHARRHQRVEPGRDAVRRLRGGAEDDRLAGRRPVTRGGRRLADGEDQRIDVCQDPPAGAVVPSVRRDVRAIDGERDLKARPYAPRLDRQRSERELEPVGRRGSSGRFDDQTVHAGP